MDWWCRIDKENRPEIYNLMTIMAAATNKTIENVYDEFKVCGLAFSFLTKIIIIIISSSSSPSIYFTWIHDWITI